MIFLILTCIFAAFDWSAVNNDNKQIGYFTKPAVIVSLLLWLLIYAKPFEGLQSPPGIDIRWIVWALVFSLAGDVLLMLPKQQFLPALIAFALAHIGYIQGFAQPVFSERYVLPGIIISCLVIAVSMRVYVPIARNIREKGLTSMKIPAAIYTVLISAMLISAISTLMKGWGVASAYLVVSGGLLFYFSDILLSWNRFVAPLDHAEIKVRVSYHLAQIFLVTGAVLHYLQIV